MHVGTAGKSIGQELAELTNLFLGLFASYFSSCQRNAPYASLRRPLFVGIKSAMAFHDHCRCGPIKRCQRQADRHSHRREAPMIEKVG